MTQRDTLFLTAVLSTIEAHLDDAGFGVTMLAAELGLSRVQLHRRVRRCVGVPPGVLIRRRRLDRAARLLQVEKMTVTEVVYAVGWSNLSHFAKMFRRRYGVVPSSWQPVCETRSL